MRTRLVILSISVLLSSALQAQTLMRSVSSKVDFSAGKDLLEPIKATNIAAQFVYRDEDQSLVALIPMSAFEFPNKLMQEHFNENYLDTETYPHASFSGKLTSSISEFNSKKREVVMEAKGKLALHGVTRNLVLTINVRTDSNGQHHWTTSFKLRLEDYDIEIPSLMFYKIAEEVQVTANIVMP